MNDRLEAVALKLRGAANIFAPANKLPPELLRAIFLHLRPDIYCDWTRSSTLPYADLCAISRVCRRWRGVAISAPELWTCIILADSPDESEMDETPMARLCMLRSGARPLDLFYPLSFGYLFLDGELIPDHRRVRSLVFVYEDELSENELFNFLSTASCLERLEIVGTRGFWLALEAPEVALPCLRELVISKCNPWSNHKFGSLTSLSLLGQVEIETEIFSIIDTLRCTPLLEELVLERGSSFRAEPAMLPAHDITRVPLHSLRKLHVCRLSDRATMALVDLLDLPPRGMFMRFTDISEDGGPTFAEFMNRQISPLAATKLELIYPPERGLIIHATDGATHTRFANRKTVGHSRLLDWILKRPPRYPLKEFWLRVDRDVDDRIQLPHASCGLETLVIDTADENAGAMLNLWLSPKEDGVPFPLLSTIELQSVPGVVNLEHVLKIRSDAGHRLRTLRIRCYAGCEARVVHLAPFVDRVDIYHADGKARRGMELPEECMTRGRWWGPWDQSFTEEMECERAW